MEGLAGSSLTVKMCNVMSMKVTSPLPATFSISSVLTGTLSRKLTPAGFHVNLRLTYIILSAELTEGLAILAWQWVAGQH